MVSACYLAIACNNMCQQCFSPCQDMLLNFSDLQTASTASRETCHQIFIGQPGFASLVDFPGFAGRWMCSRVCASTVPNPPLDSVMEVHLMQGAGPRCHRMYRMFCIIFLLASSLAWAFASSSFSFGSIASQLHCPGDQEFGKSACHTAEEPTSVRPTLAVRKNPSGTH